MTPDAIASLSPLDGGRSRFTYHLGRNAFADMVSRRKLDDAQADALLDGIIIAWSERLTAKDPRYVADPEARFFVQSHHLLDLAERITDRARHVAAATRKPLSDCADKSGHAQPTPTDPAR